MLQGINNAKKVMQNSAQYLLGRSIWREESGDHVHFNLVMKLSLKLFFMYYNVTCTHWFLVITN